MLLLDPERLEELDRSIRTFLATGERGALRIIGAGELSCVVEWGGRACKRLPPVAELERATCYGSLVAEYVGALREVGVPVVETGFQVASGETDHVGYIVQPRLPAHTLLPAVLRAMDPEEALLHFRTLLDHVEACVTAGVGIDPQISNWALREGRPLLLDVTTPMLRDERGRDRLDTELFIAMLPRMIQGIVRRHMVDDLLEKNFEHRTILLDLVGNVVNYGLGHFTDAFLEAANERLDRPIPRSEVDAYRREEKWTWWALRKAFAVEQLWRKHVLRTPALHLLPSHFRG